MVVVALLSAMRRFGEVDIEDLLAETGPWAKLMLAVFVKFKFTLPAEAEMVIVPFLVELTVAVVWPLALVAVG